MTHAMVISGVHLDSKTGRPVRYKVENSWGETAGEKGYFVMTDRWFEQCVFLPCISVLISGPSLRYTVICFVVGAVSDLMMCRFVYQVVVPKALAPKDLVKVFESGEKTVLAPWDPMYVCFHLSHPGHPLLVPSMF